MGRVMLRHRPCRRQKDRVPAIDRVEAVLARLRARHPELVLEVAPSNAPAKLTEQEADLAVRTYRPSGDMLVARKLGDVALRLFAHRDYLADRGTPKTLSDLVRHDMIGPDRSPLDLRLAQTALPPDVLNRVVVRTDSHPAQLALARAGLGIAVVQRGSRR